MADDSSNPTMEVLSPESLTPQVIEQLKEELTCSICLDILQDPRILPCYHSFCRCLSNMQVQPGQVLKCPYCSTKFYLEGDMKDIPADCRTNAFLQCIKGPEAPIQEEEESREATDTEMIHTDHTGESIEMNTLCPMCKWTLIEPRQLTCGHSCCTRCLERMIKLTPIVDCPSCGMKSDTSTEGIFTLPIDGERLLEVLNAESPLDEDAIHLDIQNDELDDESLPDDSAPLITNEPTDTTTNTQSLRPASSRLTPLRQCNTAPPVEDRPVKRWEVGAFILCLPLALPGLLLMGVFYGGIKLLIWIFLKIRV